MHQPRYWAVREALGRVWRTRARRLADAVLAPTLGSWRGFESTASVAVTFDDGPEPSVTPRLLELLAASGARCTFFLLVDQARKEPGLVRDIVEEGHEVGLHGADHRRLTGMSFGDAAAYVGTAKDDLEAIAQQPVRFYRPPYGSQSVRSYLAARRSGLTVVVWSADAADWTDRDVDDVARDGLQRLGPGGVLLLHERLEPDPLRDAPTTSFDRIDLVRLVIAGVHGRGWELETVGSMAARHPVRRTAWFRP
jgi:peptidoglycan/xylan/chitin deacetylase (PgdA/CDA1 family)